MHWSHRVTRLAGKTSTRVAPEGLSLGFLFYATSFGGAERRFLRLANFLGQEGIPVFLFCNPEVQASAHHMGIDLSATQIVPIGRYPQTVPSSRKFSLSRFKKKLAMVTTWSRAISIIRSRDITHLHMVANPGVLVLFFSLFSRWLPPLSFSYFGELKEATWLHAHGEKLALRFAAPFVKKIDCLVPTYSEFARNYVPRSHWNKLSVAPCSFSDYSKVSFSKRRDIDAVFLSRFVEGKGTGFLQEIETRLSEQRASLHVVGRGPLIDPTKHINLYQTTAPYEILGRAKVFLSIQENNNYPSQSLLEAMASECAVVATDVGMTRLLLDESVAVLVPPEAEKIADAVLHLLRNPELALRLAKAGRERATHLHTIERFSIYFLGQIVEGPSQLTGT